MGGLFRELRQFAVLNQIPFTLDPFDFLAMLRSKCFYCGRKAKDVPDNYMSEEDTRVYHGIDRLDPEMGFYPENVKPVCRTCQDMKNELDHDQFLKMILRIYNRSCTPTQVLNNLKSIGE